MTTHAIATMTKRNKTSVSFKEDEELCSYHDGAVVDLLASSRKEIWYQQQDLSHIKRKAMVLAKEAHKYGFGSLLTNTYGRPCDETQDVLITWTRNANSRRGLERWINDEYAAKRADIRRRTIQSVLRAQAKMREEGIHDADYGTKVIARLSEAFSIDSRHFALGLGKADETAAKECVSFDDESLSLCSSVSSTKCSSERVHSPTSVAIQHHRVTARKNLALSSTSTGNDMRQFF